jgi:hypothetical protein
MFIYIVVLYRFIVDPVFWTARTTITSGCERKINKSSGTTCIELFAS